MFNVLQNTLIYIVSYLYFVFFFVFFCILVLILFSPVLLSAAGICHQYFLFVLLHFCTSNCCILIKDPSRGKPYFVEGTDNCLMTLKSLCWQGTEERPNQIRVKSLRAVATRIQDFIYGNQITGFHLWQPKPWQLEYRFSSMATKDMATRIQDFIYGNQITGFHLWQPKSWQLEYRISSMATRIQDFISGNQSYGNQNIGFRLQQLE